ncbi:19240_t:CDS:2 [Gigaspora rosea]|nr:19240_t:CDS:2 [Gigaspora rosea]
MVENISESLYTTDPINISPALFKSEEVNFKGRFSYVTKTNQRIDKDTNNFRIKLWFDHYRKICSEDVFNARVNNRISNQISVQDKLIETNLRKRKERSKKVFRLFSNIGGIEAIEAIEQIKFFNATTILNLSTDDFDFVIVRLNE